MGNYKKSIQVNLKKKTDDYYPVIISGGINIAAEIKKLKIFNNFAIITDDKVYKLYKEKIEKQFNDEKLNFRFIVFKNGEKSKNLKVFSRISEQLLKLNFDRKSAIITLGGGVPGDMGGFAAGTFMRGIPFIQAPTTLLSMVDSSIGGKVAVDLKYGKNSSGLFYQPKAVFIDIDFLNTLSEDDFYNGMFEIIKHGIIRDKKYFEFIEKNIDKIKNKDADALTELIHGSVLIKTQVVEKDEKESGLRQILNFGHTAGHAIETVNNYKLKHGFAVGLGMILESKIALNEKLLSISDFKRIESLINAFNTKKIKYSRNKFFEMIMHDKKNVKNEKSMEQLITFVLPVQIGKTVIRKYSISQIKEYF